MKNAFHVFNGVTIKGVAGAALAGLMLALPGAAQAAEGADTPTCWSGQILIPSDKEYDMAKARVKVFQYKLDKNPDDPKAKQELATMEKIAAGYTKDATPVQMMFVKGGRLPVVVDDPVPFVQGQSVTFKVQTCEDRGVEGFCSQDASVALKGQPLTTEIHGAGVFPTKDGYSGFVQLYLKPTLEGKSGIAFARLQYLGPPFGAPDDTSLSGEACPQ